MSEQSLDFDSGSFPPEPSYSLLPDSESTVRSQFPHLENTEILGVESSTRSSSGAGSWPPGPYSDLYTFIGAYPSRSPGLEVRQDIRACCTLGRSENKRLQERPGQVRDLGVRVLEKGVHGLEMKGQLVWRTGTWAEGQS